MKKGKSGQKNSRKCTSNQKIENLKNEIPVPEFYNPLLIGKTALGTTNRHNACLALVGLGR